MVAGQLMQPGSEEHFRDMQMKGDEAASYYQNVVSREIMSDGVVEASHVKSNQKSDRGLILSQDMP